MADSDLISLYSGRLLELAADIPLTGRLSAPEGTARKRSPICGSTVTVDVVMRDGRIAEFAQDVRACALGQASASILGRVVIGRSQPEIEQAKAALSAMLTGAEAPKAPFDQYEYLSPARDYRNRHASIMLALEATLEAVLDAEAKAKG